MPLYLISPVIIAVTLPTDCACYNPKTNKTDNLKARSVVSSTWECMCNPPEEDKTDTKNKSKGTVIDTEVAG